MNRTIAPPVHNFGTLYLQSPHFITLPSGIKLYICSGGEIDVNRLTIAIPGGEVESPSAGLASCTASLLAEGSSSYSGEEIANRLEYAGAWINTSVSTHYTSVTLCSLNDKLGFLLPIIHDMILHPSFPEDSTSRILQRNAAKIAVEREKVAFLADEAVRPLAYGLDNPLARTETPDELLSFTPARISSFHQSRLDPHNVHIFLSGKITDKMTSLVTDAFSKFPNQSHFPINHICFDDTVDTPLRKDIKRKSAKQGAIKIMIPAIGRTHPDFLALRAAVTALGGYFGSRLMLNIREDKGLTYGISAVLLGYSNRSFITIETQTATDSVEEVIDLIYGEIERMKDPASYTDDEISRLSKLLMSNLAAALDTPFSRMDFFKTRIYASTPDNYFEAQQAMANSISPKFLADISQRYFNLQRIRIATVG